MRRFFVDRLDARDGLIRLSPEETRHLSKVLRLGPGDRIELVAAAGGEAQAEVVHPGPEAAILRILEVLPGMAPPRFFFDMALGLLKAGKMDDLVRSLVELGVRKIVPFAAGRSVSRLDEKRAGEKRLRWEKIAREAVKQCGRPDTPEISPVLTFSDLISLAGGYDLRLAFYEGKRGPATLPGTGEKRPRSVLAVIGPEGGLTPEEAGTLAGAGFVLAGLGPRILRAETAALAAGTLVCHHYGDMGSAGED
ncbi:MAG: RsmE family RNA methyltransferase [Thermodesulfobacteriota bacterium]